ncbi:unnamed protein product [Protopolystoma xenopodis]|uniref:Uncharacterized protein n=1 Tax=Protopolystoma xenopodis TaxID=117903 RepID=A0A448WWD0_9PLAT|nr:unnamed protein product [Protopolystoma xenopodis]
MPSNDPRWAGLHSFSCSRCRQWDHCPFAPDYTSSSLLLGGSITPTSCCYCCSYCCICSQVTTSVSARASHMHTRSAGAVSTPTSASNSSSASASASASNSKSASPSASPSPLHSDSVGRLIGAGEMHLHHYHHHQCQGSHQCAHSATIPLPVCMSPNNSGGREGYVGHSVSSAGRFSHFAAACVTSAIRSAGLDSGVGPDSTSTGSSAPLPPASGFRGMLAQYRSAVLQAASCNFLVCAFKYLLPRLLLLPIFHFFYLHELIEVSK